MNPLRKKPHFNESELVPYVGLPETNDLEIKEVLKRPMYEVDGRNIILKGDILFARIEPSIFNKKYILANKLFGFDYAFTSTEFYVTKAKESSDQMYLFYSLFTDTVFNQIKGKTTGSTGRRRLDRNVFERIIIPYPSQEVRDKVVVIMNNAVKQKQQKEQQAKDLLNSIDDYLLQELGIQLPTPPDNNISNRMFTSSWQKVAGNRFDPFYNNFYFEEINNAVKNGKLKSVFLRNIIKTNLIKGCLPNADEKNGDNKVVQINSINEDGTFNLSNVITAKNVFTKHQQLQKNDILVVITGATIGKIGFWNEEDEYYLGGDIVKFQTEANSNPYYVFSYLRSKAAQIELKRNITGATNGHLSPHDINNLLIPVPTSPKENDLINSIAKEIEKRRKLANSLQAEAQHQFNQTKQEIERMILE